ncbi:septum formation family protein [Nocardioides daejeonensis]|uniref:septum formation family protein n=1 Tax=Nocardioides daejeonensis TaxID=1046556 RepID=UPI0013A57543|nr:septum formation family protein [Nocardioides daejeonensis]
MTLLLTGCQEQAPAPASERAQVGPAVVWAEPVADARAGMPNRGACHRLPAGLTGGSTDAAATVPCSDPHTSVTYLSGVLPAEIEEAPQAWVAQRCSAALPEAAGLDVATMPAAFLEWVWLQPDQAQRDRGARWFRCDVRSLAPAPAELPGAGLPVFRGDLPERWTRCVSTEQGDEAAYVTCDQPHQFHWTASVPVSGEQHPGNRAWEELAAAECRPLVGQAAFWFTYPNQAQWDAGDRRLSCYRAV